MDRAANLDDSHVALAILAFGRAGPWGLKDAARRRPRLIRARTRMMTQTDDSTMTSALSRGAGRATGTAMACRLDERGERPL